MVRWNPTHLMSLPELADNQLINSPRLPKSKFKAKTCSVASLNCSPRQRERVFIPNIVQVFCDAPSDMFRIKLEMLRNGVSVNRSPEPTQAYAGSSPVFAQHNAPQSCSAYEGHVLHLPTCPAMQ